MAPLAAYLCIFVRPVVPARWIRQVSKATHLHLGESGNLEMEEASELDYEEEAGDVREQASSSESSESPKEKKEEGRLLQ